MRRPLYAAMLLAGAVVAAFPVSAQAPETPSARVNPAPLDRFGALQGTELQISSGTEDDTLSLGVALPTGASQESRFSLVLATPLRRGDGSMPASLDALANGTRLTLRWGRFRLAAPTPNDYALTIRNDAVRECHRVEGLAAECEPNYAVRTHLLEKYRDYLSNMIPSGATDIGLDASIGINDFEWFDQATMLPQQERRTDWSVGGHLSHYLSGSMTAVTLSASYQRAHEATEEQQVCPANQPGSDACRMVRIAAPTRNENLLASAGLRHRFTGADGRLLPIALAPQVTYDVIDNVWGVDVPVYFVAGDDGGLTGGVRFGYRSDRDNAFSVGVFFGAAFNILQ